ncbi:hypothetical protein MG293_018089 [Ovis ammon polii]|uniref:Uncharacterized protein n=1 Tax=Ovis ammon polii TaxID=230172 RepID=A0AAD4TTX1_OVIAM|nr:hypothetical protein MG293_018089 [Ovis ammon polii]
MAMYWLAVPGLLPAILPSARAFHVPSVPTAGWSDLGLDGKLPGELMQAELTVSLIRLSIHQAVPPLHRAPEKACTSLHPSSAVLTVLSSELRMDDTNIPGAQSPDGRQRRYNLTESTSLSLEHNPRINKEAESHGVSPERKRSMSCGPIVKVADPPTVCVTVGRTEALLLIIELGARMPVQIVDIGGLLRSK